MKQKNKPNQNNKNQTMKPLFLFPLAPLSELWEQRRLFNIRKNPSFREIIQEDQEKLSAQIEERKADLAQKIPGDTSKTRSERRDKDTEKGNSAGSLTPEGAAKIVQELTRKQQIGLVNAAQAASANGEYPTLGDAIAELSQGLQKLLGGSNASLESPTPVNDKLSHFPDSSAAGTRDAMATISDPETRQKVSEFCNQYRGGQYLSEDFRDSPYIRFTGSEKCIVNNEVLPDLAKLAVIYHQKTGRKLTITSAYRDIAHQERLQNDPNPAATPGNSNHNTGHALDFGQDVVRGYPGFGALARACNFTGISSENWHFNHASMKSPGQERMAFAQQVDRSVA